jgi:hypothetical protein
MAKKKEGVDLARFYHRLSDQDHATVLAALRLYQENLRLSDEPMPQRFVDIATNDGAHPEMSADEIDLLCEQLNS